MKINVYGYNLEIYHHPAGFWGDDRILFEKEPSEETQRDIVQYLYSEGFISDRRTICQSSSRL